MAEDAFHRILLGRIAGAHGLKGEVLIHSFARVPESIAAYGPLSDAEGGKIFTITRAKPTAKGVVARLAGVGDREAAEALMGLGLYVARARLPPPAEDEFYHADLIGLEAVDPAGRVLGRISAVHNFGAGDLIEIRLAGSGKTELVPFTSASVPSLDVTAGRAVVVMPAVHRAPPATD
ncbi:MAG TPA: ribosome maturation factor RimM [Hyphomicrobiaceae bacterium]|nr:ribosome maturation factor RimM [Hyphomicrobiaceae bacterium]